MIYLIKQPSWRSGYVYFKVGYAKDLDRRIIQYESHCLDTEVVVTRIGDIPEEFLIHRYLHGFPCIKFIKSEWYQVSEDMSSWFVEKFSKDYKVMEEEVLKDLSEISETLFKYLSEKYPDDQRIKTYKLSKMDTMCFISEEISKNPEFPKEIRDFFLCYSKKRRIFDRLKYLCEFSLQTSPEIVNTVLDQIPETDLVKKYFVLGPDRCKATGYNVTKLNQELGVVFFNEDTLKEAIYYQFKEGERYTLKDIKLLLGQIYTSLSYTKTPKATDLEKYFEVKICRMLDQSTGKRDKSYELIKKLL